MLSRHGGMGPVSETKEHPRPPQTTLVGWVVLLGSVYLVLQAIDSLGGLRTREMQELVDEMIEAMGNPAGVTQADGLAWLRTSAVVSAVCAAACAVLGWFALRRDRGARIGLSVLAAPLLLASTVTGGFVTVMVVASIILLWGQPSRNWFAGLPPLEAPKLSEQPPLSRRARRDADADSAREAERDAQWDAQWDAPQTQAPTGDTGARAVQGFGTQPSVPAGPNAQQPVPGAPSAVPAGGFSRPAAAPLAPGQRPPRPAALVRACVITFVFAGLGFISSAISTMVALTAGDELMQDLLDQQPVFAEEGFTAEQLGSMLALVGGIMAFFSLLVIAAAALALAGNPVGRVLMVLMVSGVLVFALVGILTSPFMAIPAAASLFVLLQVNRAEVGAWMRDVAGR